MRFVTDFADLAVVLPLVVCVAAALAASGWWRGGGAVLAAAVATLSAMLMLKLLFLACASGSPRPVSPSGHVGAGTVTYGGLAALWLRRRWPIVAAVAVGALPVAGLLAASRLALHVHSLGEVLAGACVGVSGAALMAWLAGPPQPGLRIRRSTMAAVAVVVVLLHGTRVPAEARIHGWSGWMPRGVCAQLGM
jgi:membrane-associated phospholipid phosphatase